MVVIICEGSIECIKRATLVGLKKRWWL